MTKMNGNETYIDSQVCMKQRLEFPIRWARIPDRKTGLQIFSIQGQGISDAELVLLPLGSDVVQHCV